MPERTPTPTIASIPEGEVLFEGTPLACANKVLREKKVCTGEARQLRSLEATRRVLLQVEEARAVAKSDIPSVSKPRRRRCHRGTKIISTLLTVMLPLSSSAAGDKHSDACA